MNTDTVRRGDEQVRCKACAESRGHGSARRQFSGVRVGVVALAGLGWAVSAHAQTVAVQACAVVTAGRTSGWAAAVHAAPDTERIQAALNLCEPGRAVVLAGNGADDAFLSAPLRLPRGVTLFVGRGVTLYASRNPKDYDLRPGSCGEPNAKRPGCKPFLFAYQAALSGVAGEGTIDGQGSGTMRGSRNSWRRIRQQAKMPAHEGNAQGSAPDLVASYESQGFSVRGVHLKNAAGDSVAMYKTIGFRARTWRLSPQEVGTACC